MYQKTKFLLYASGFILILFTFVTIGVTKSNFVSEQEKQNELQKLNAGVQNSVSQPRQRIPEMNVVRVSEDTKNFMYPSEDPLRTLDKENMQFETPQLPNPVSRPSGYTSSSAVQEFDPFRLNSANSIKSASDAAGENSDNKQASKEMKLYNIDNTPAADYDILKTFKINSTEFYILSHKPLSIQRMNGFTNRKYYIYKKNSGTLVQCFDLFERQERADKDVSELLSIRTMSGDTEIVFSGTNSVTRVIDNNQLLSPYGDKKDRVLLIKSE